MLSDLSVSVTLSEGQGRKVVRKHPWLLGSLTHLGIPSLSADCAVPMFHGGHFLMDTNM